ncbi:GAF domain-containing protein [Collinsella bouchesdurhonensis]|uniref:GAF domain-containing protein n=1 Tax=Collinsella bouchesdurhonensis TaxID=1907654 RepID=UPI0034A3854C
MDIPVDYELLVRQIEALAQADNHWLPVLSNASACLFEAMDNINWAGFYLVDESTRDKKTPELRLGPFQGKVACVRIPFGRGVCGTAAAEDKTQLVSDVHAFSGHIACDAASRSEVVVPLHCGGRVVGVLDIDSPLLDRFSAYDARGLESFVCALENCICWNAC